MNSEMLESIREAEKASHTDVYRNSKLFEMGSWLAKPVKTVMDLSDCFVNRKSLNVLDLGCGVGRNIIPLAQKYSNIDFSADCVDILDFAIEKLCEYSHRFGVENSLNGIVSSIEAFEIAENNYDFIFAVSALEHVESESVFEDKLNQIKAGLKPDGIACLILNSQINEFNVSTGEPMDAQFEVNLSTESLKSMLNSVFKGFEVIRNTVVSQEYDIPRGEAVAHLTTDVVTFAVKKLF